MRLTRFLSLFCILSSVWANLWAQTQPHSGPTARTTLADSTMEWLDWQQQILDNVDADQLTERSYAQLLEMLYDLDIQQHLMPDSVIQRLDNAAVGRPSGPRPHHLRQVVMFSTDQTLNRREGYRQPTASRRAASRAYLGDPVHGTLRYQASYTDGKLAQWRTGLVLDKDAGERWSAAPPWGDSYSLYAAYSHDRGMVRQAIVGHYRVSLGCGLLCQQSFSLGKLMMGQTLLQHRPLLAVHSSASESDYMQGAAVTLHLTPHIEFTPFVSVRSLDGRRQGDTLTSISQDGYHRTQSELDRRHASLATLVGGRLSHQGERHEIGFNALYTHLQHPYHRPLHLYNRHLMRGSELGQASLDCRLQWRGLRYSSETALSHQGGWSTLQAVQGRWFDPWLITLLLRHYSRHYLQLWANALSESSTMQGETGQTLLIDGSLSRHWDVQCMADLFQFSSPQYRISRRSHGHELSSTLSGHWQYLQHQWRLTLRYRHKVKYHDSSDDQSSTDIVPYTQQLFSLQGTYQSEQGLSLRTQAQQRFYSEQGPGTTRGTALSQTIAWRRPDRPLSGSLQAAWFDATDYDCRLYLSEPNVLYGFNIPMLYGQGWRMSATCRYQLGRRLTIQGKYARTLYRGASNISSGLQQVRGNHLDQLWLLVRYKI